MTASPALQLASRMHAMLLLQLNHGIEPSRMLSDPLYARDVLLVCDAHRGSELAALAQQFRASVAQDAAERRLAASSPGAKNAGGRSAGRQRSHADRLPGAWDDVRVDRDDREDRARALRADGRRSATGSASSGFSASRFFGSLFGPLAPPDRAPARSVRPQRGWFGRWSDTGK